MKKRRLVLLLIVALLGVFVWYQSIPQVPDGQAPLATIDANSLPTLRAEFNRNIDRVRLIVLLSPT
jgi:hypothetical protein